MTARHPGHAGIHFPPPLLFVAGLAAGFFCQRWRPLQLAPPGVRPAGVVVGWLLVAASGLLAAWAMTTFARQGTAIYPNRPATVLVTVGPYRHSRNPMYVALSLLYLGVSVLIDSTWPVLFLPAVWASLSFLVVRREERYLAAAFGDAYHAYRKRVRRWL